MLPAQEPPAIVEPAPVLDVPFDETLPELPASPPGEAPDDPAGDDPDREARAPDADPAALLRAERRHLCEFLASLAEFDRARSWRALGHPSLLAYLVRDLGLSSASAYQRAVAAGLLRRFPELMGPLRDGRLCLAQVVDLARVITPDNRRDVLRRFTRDEPRPLPRPPASILATRLLLGNDWREASGGA